MRDAISNAHSLAKAELATIRLRLLKLGARVIETVSRVRLAFAAACSDAGFDPATCHHDRSRRTMTTRAVGALNQSDQPSARSQRLIKPRCRRPSPGWRFKIRKALLRTGQIWQGRVYSRPRGRDSVAVSFFEGGTDGFGT